MIKLKEILSSLSEKERLAVRNWIRFEFDDDFEEIDQLFEALSGTLNRPLNKIQIYSLVFPKEEFDDKKWRYLISDLYASMYRYLAYKEFRLEPTYEKILGLKQLRKRGLSDVFAKEARRIRDTMEKLPLRNAQYFYHSSLLEEEFYEEESSEHRQASERLQTQSDRLNAFFVLKKLQIYCSVQSHTTLAGTRYSDDFRERIHASANEWQDVPVTEVYQRALSFLGDEVEEHDIELFVKAIEEADQLLTSAEIRKLYLMAINYCIRKYNESKGEYLNRVFELYKRGLEKSIFMENNRLSRFTYRNICSAAIGLNQHQWVESFLLEYRPYLKAKYRQDQYNYNLAVLYSSQQKYEEAVELLRDSKFEDPLLLLNARRLLIKIYYQQGEFKTLSYLLDSFWSYLYRHKELGYHRKNYLNLVKYVRKLLQIPPYDMARKKRLSRVIQMDSNIAEKNWLIEQLA